MQENRYCKSLLIWKLEEIISKECNSLDLFNFFFWETGRFSERMRDLSLKRNAETIKDQG